MENWSTSQQLSSWSMPSPKTDDLASRFALRGHFTPPGHQRLRHSTRAALCWLLPSDGEFRRASHSLHYYLARQGWRVVLRGGDATRPFYESRMNWVVDPRAACITSAIKRSFSCPHARHFDATFRSSFQAAKTPEVTKEEKEEGCMLSQ